MQKKKKKKEVGAGGGGGGANHTQANVLGQLSEPPRAGLKLGMFFFVH